MVAIKWDAINATEPATRIKASVHDERYSWLDERNVGIATEGSATENTEQTTQRMALDTLVRL